MLGGQISKYIYYVMYGYSEAKEYMRQKLRNLTWNIETKYRLLKFGVIDFLFYRI